MSGYNSVTQGYLGGGASGGGPATSVPISGLTAAVATNAINNFDFAQGWNWDTLSLNKGLSLSSNSTFAAANAQTILAVELSGTNANSTQTTYAAKFSNTHTGATSTNVAAQFTASGGTNNYAIIVPASGGFVGIGTFAPTAPLTVANNGIASIPAHNITGTWYTGGSATTTKPQVLIEPSGTTSTGWNTSGTALGINAASGFTGNLLDLQTNGVSKAYVTYSGIAGFTVVSVGGSGYYRNGNNNFHLYGATTGTGSIGALTLYDGSESGAAFLQLGGTSSSYPGISRNGTDIDIMLANNSAYTGLRALKLTSTKLKGSSSIPTITAGSASGSSATASLSSNSTDMAGEVIITTAGNDEVVGGIIATVTFNSSYNTAPFISLSPSNQNAANTPRLYSPWYIESSTTEFVIKQTDTFDPLQDGVDYKFHYHVIQ